MEELNKNWITEGLIDFEYKKYLLLAYLQQVHHHFTDHKLYPYLSDLMRHHNNLIEIKKQKDALQNFFPKQLSKADFKTFELLYEKVVNDDSTMQEMEIILEYAISKIKEEWKVGKEIYDNIENQISISPVGISPLKNDFGYLMIYTQHHKEINVYSYQVSIYENSYEAFRAIRTEFVANFPKSITNTFETIKIQLLRKYKEIVNPATFLVEVSKNYPIQETVLPIAKRSLIQYLSVA